MDAYVKSEDELKKECRKQIGVQEILNEIQILVKHAMIRGDNCIHYYWTGDTDSIDLRKVYNLLCDKGYRCDLGMSDQKMKWDNVWKQYPILHVEWGDKNQAWTKYPFLRR